MKPVTMAAKVATLIRGRMKKNFRGTKFYVTSKTYSGGSSVTVRWSGGPQESEVDALVEEFRSGYFDSSEDIYLFKRGHYTPSVRYIHICKE